MKKIGLVTAMLGIATAESVVSAAAIVRHVIPSGRYAAMVWEMSPVLTAQIPLEVLALESIMGAAPERGALEDQKIVYAGHIVVRCYDRQHTLMRTLYVLLTKASGEPAYARRTEMEDLKREYIEIDAVFTRDIANNVWHLPDDTAEDAVISRLQRLFTWSDEVVLNVSNSIEVGRVRTKEKSLIPRATKVQYSWDRLSVNTRSPGFRQC
jgi:hypothetical protein